MTPEERREIINLLKEVYQFHIGSWSEKAEEEFMEKLRNKIDELENQQVRKTWGLK